MLSQRNACAICLLVLIFVTSAVTDESSSSDSSSEEQQAAAAKPIERQPKVDSGSGDSDSGKSAEMVESGGKITKAILRDQDDNGDVSSERRKKRHAFFYRTGNKVRRGE